MGLPGDQRRGDDNNNNNNGGDEHRRGGRKGDDKRGGRNGGGVKRGGHDGHGKQDPKGCEKKKKHVKFNPVFLITLGIVGLGGWAGWKGIDKLRKDKDEKKCVPDPCQDNRNNACMPPKCTAQVIRGVPPCRRPIPMCNAQYSNDKQNTQCRPVPRLVPRCESTYKCMSPPPPHPTSHCRDGGNTMNTVNNVGNRFGQNY
jgi:hypothetical protein